TSDPVLDKELRQTWQSPRPRHRRPVHVHCSGKPGKPFVAEMHDTGVIRVQAASAMSLAIASQHPLNAQTLTAHFSRLGGTSFFLEQIHIDDLEPGCILPVSEINRLRRQLVSLLETQLSK